MDNRILRARQSTSCSHCVRRHLITLIWKSFFSVYEFFSITP